jgi:hypothetical protein
MRAVKYGAKVVSDKCGITKRLERFPDMQTYGENHERYS